MPFDIQHRNAKATTTTAKMSIRKIEASEWGTNEKNEKKLR